MPALQRTTAPGAPWWRRLLCGGMLLLSAGCVAQYVHAPGVDIITLDLVAVATPTLNTDETGQPNSVVLRVYELSDSASFQQASAGAFWEDDERVLGDALIASRVIILQPGAEQALQMQLRPNTRYLGVAANFARPQGDSWRQLSPVSARRRQIRVMVREDNLSLEQR